MAVKESDILDLLDEGVRTMELCAFDNGYVYPLGSRLHIYSDGGRWAILIEVLTHNPRQGPVLWDEVECHGSACADQGLAATYERLRVAPEGGDTEAFPSILRVDVGGQEIEGEDLGGQALQDAFRILVDRAPGLLYATEEELVRVLAHPPPRILSLDEWHHPDVVGGEPPSETSTFRQLAAVIARTDPGAYQPDEQPNSHWGNWPEAGTL